MKTICRYISEVLNLDSETYEVMYYGMFVCVTNLASILSVIIIGALLKELENTVIFLTCFMPLRLYVGGYHASTPLKCYWYFNVVASLFIVLFKWNANVFMMSFITIALLIIVLVQVIINKGNKAKGIIIMILVYLILIVLLYCYDKYIVFLWSIILNVLLYEVKVMQTNI